MSGASLPRTSEEHARKGRVLCAASDCMADPSTACNQIAALILDRLARKIVPEPRTALLRPEALSPPGVQPKRASEPRRRTLSCCHAALIPGMLEMRCPGLPAPAGHAHDDRVDEADRPRDQRHRREARSPHGGRAFARAKSMDGSFRAEPGTSLSAKRLGALSSGTTRATPDRQKPCLRFAAPHRSKTGEGKGPPIQTRTAAHVLHGQAGHYRRERVAV